MHPFAFLPFGAGPRRCLGEQLAYVEAKVVVAVLLQRFAVRLHPSQTGDDEFVLTMRPKHGMKVVLQRRDVALGGTA